MPLVCVAEKDVSPNDVELHEIGTKLYLVNFLLIIYLISHSHYVLTRFVLRLLFCLFSLPV